MFEQILSISKIRNIRRTVTRIYMLISGLKGLRYVWQFKTSLKRPRVILCVTIGRSPTREYHEDFQLHWAFHKTTHTKTIIRMKISKKNFITWLSCVSLPDEVWRVSTSCCLHILNYRHHPERKVYGIINIWIVITKALTQRQTRLPLEPDPGDGELLYNSSFRYHWFYSLSMLHDSLRKATKLLKFPTNII